MATSTVGDLAAWSDTAQTKVTNARPPYLLVSASDTPTPIRKASQHLCDGTSDQIEINAAIDAANAAGISKVLIADGHYEVSGVITLKSNVTLELSDNATIKLANGTNTSIVTNQSGADKIRVVGKGTLDGNVANQTNNGSYNKHVLRLNTATGVLIQDINVINAGTDGMNFIDVPGVKVHRTKINNCYNHGITFQNCDYAWFIENEISNTGSTTDALGFTDSGMGIIGVNVASDYVQMRGNLLYDLGDSGLRNERNGVGWLIDDNTVLRTGKDSIKIMGVVGSNVYAEKNIVSNNIVIEAGNDGILALGDNNSIIGNFIYLTGQNSNVTKRVSGNGINLSNDGSGALVADNWILDAFLHGINGVGGANHTLRNNKIFRSGQNGIYLINCDKATVEWNTTANNSQSNDDTYSGIRVGWSSGAALTHILIRYNRSYDDQVSATQRWGLWLEGSTNVSDSQATDNDFWGNIGGPIFNDWTGPRNLVSAGAPSMAIADLGENGFYLKDDFLISTSSNTVGELGWNRGGTGSGSVNFGVTSAGRPGIVRLDTGATSGSMSYMRGAATTGGSFLAAEMFDEVWKFRLNVNDANVTARFGFGADGAASPPTNGVYVEKLDADTQWFLVTRSAGTETRVALATVDTSWHKVRIRRQNATTIACSIDEGTEVTSTTNIPTAALTPFAHIVNSAASSKTWDVHFWSLRITGIL